MKNRKSIIAVLAVLLVAAIAIGSTLAFLTDSDQVVNTFVLGEDIEIRLTEDSYEDPYDFSPGRAYAKDPMVTAQAGCMFMRMIVGFYNVEWCDTEEEYVTGALITNQARINLIKQMIWYDSEFTPGNIGATPPGTLQPQGGYIPVGVVTNPPTPLTAAQQMSLADLNALVGAPAHSIRPFYNAGVFMMDVDRSDLDPGRYVFIYTAPANAAAGLPANVFSANTNAVPAADPDQATLFTTVVFPSCWGNEQMRILRGDNRDAEGNLIGGDAGRGHGFQIIVRAEAIQITGFASHVEAFNALDGYSPFWP